MLTKKPKIEIWITGIFDEVSQKEFQSRGWKVINDATEMLMK